MESVWKVNDQEAMDEMAKQVKYEKATEFFEDARDDAVKLVTALGDNEVARWPHVRAVRAMLMASATLNACIVDQDKTLPDPYGMSEVMLQGFNRVVQSLEANKDD